MESEDVWSPKTYGGNESEDVWSPKTKGRLEVPMSASRGRRRV